MKLSIFVVVFLFHLIDADYIDIREATLSSLSRSSHTCKTEGLLCSSNCLSIAKCMNGVIRTVSTCLPGQFCNDDSGQPVCGSSMGFRCFAKLSSIKFKCAGLGFFSDAVACNKYHFCYEPVGSSGAGITTSTTPLPDVPYDPSTNYVNNDKNCDANHAYTPTTATCEPNPRPCPTTFPIRLCKTPGESFQVNGPIYVICQQYSNNERILYPFQYRCKINRFPCPFP